MNFSILSRRVVKSNVQVTVGYKAEPFGVIVTILFKPKSAGKVN